MKTLESQRLILREWEYSDVNDLYEYAVSDLVGPSAGWMPHKDIKESKEIIKMFKDKQDVYAIVLKEENKVIGSIGIHDAKPDESLSHLKQKEIGFVLNPAYWGKGLVPEATRRIMKFLFEDQGLDLVWVGHFDFNEKSKRVIEKCGFNYKFTLDKELPRYNNMKVRLVQYSITRDEFFNNPKICPICGGDNGCMHNSDCWCFKVTIPEGLLESIPEEKRGKACVCKSCVEEYMEGVD